MVMTVSGDRMWSIMFQNLNSKMTTAINQSAQELASGKYANIAAKNHGQLDTLATLEHDIKMLDAFAIVQSDAQRHLEYSAQTLNAIQQSTSSLGATMIQAGQFASDVTLSAVQSQARGLFDEIFEKLNTQLDGGYIFSGIAKDSEPFTKHTDIIEQIDTNFAHLTDAQDIINAISDWIESNNHNFVQDNSARGTFHIANGNNIKSGVDKTNAAFDNLLKSFALNHLASNVSLDDTTRQKLVQNAGTTLLTTANGFTNLIAEIGINQERVANQKASDSAYKTSLSVNYNQMTSVDPYEAATTLQEHQIQLERLYAITASISKLSLMEYLR